MVYVAPEVDSDDENVEYEDESGHRYRLYLDELEEGGNSVSSRKDGSGDVRSLQGKTFCRPVKVKSRRLLIRKKQRQ